MTMPSHNQISYRPASADDARVIHQAIFAMASDLGAAAKITSTADDFRTHLSGPSPAISGLLAEAEGQLAGMCLYFPIFSTWLGKPGIFVQDIYVNAAFRRFGIGEQLLRRVAARSYAQGGIYLRLNADNSNIKAHGFYEKLGVSHLAGEWDFGAYGDAFVQLATLQNGEQS